MGAWGIGLFENDIALDLQGEFEAELSSGTEPAAAADALWEAYAEALEDPEEGPMAVLALAALLLDRGVRRHRVLDVARDVIARGAGLDIWEEAGPEELANRQGVYESLRARL
jgi:hypothetical protein